MRRLLLVLLLFAAACSSSGSAFPSGGTALDTALGRVSDTSTTRHYLEFGRPVAAAAANGGATNARGKYYRIVGYGTGTLAAYASLLPKVLGWDVLAADYAVTAGQPPNDGGLLSGGKSAPDPARLTALGATKSGSTYRFLPDRRIDPNSKLSQALQGLISLNVVRISGSQTRYSRATAGLDQTDASSHTLHDVAGIRDVASCLDDPLAAVISDTVPSSGRSTPADRPVPTSGVQFVGVGASGSSGAAPIETMCVRASSSEAAKTVAAGVRQALAGNSRAANVPWNTLLTHAVVTVSGSTVKLAATSGRSFAGVLLQAFQQGDLPGVAGSR